MLRIPTANAQGISLCACRNSGDTLRAAMPTQPSSCTMAKRRSSLSSNALRSKPSPRRAMPTAKSYMSPTYTRSSCCIDDLRVGQHSIPQSVIDVLGIDEVDGAPTEEGGELPLDVDDLPARLGLRRELDQHVDVALWPKVVSQHRAEERDTANAVPAAQSRELILRKVYVWLGHGVLTSAAIVARIVFFASHGSLISRKPQRPKPPWLLTASTHRVRAVNNHGGFGRWGFLEISDPWDAKNTIRATIAVEVLSLIHISEPTRRTPIS